MLARIFLTAALLTCLRPVTATGQQAEDAQLWRWLTQQIRAIDFEQLPPNRGIYALLRIAESCHSSGHKDLARECYDRASAIEEKGTKNAHRFLFFDYAVATDQMELARKIAERSKSDTLLDRYDIERYRRGDRDAIQDYPRGELTFYNAMELASLFVDLGEYDRAEQFVTDIKITDENEPEDVAGITLENIAKKYRDQGDMENARLYIDKAKRIAGNQFYTGYAINITHRSMHGRLTEDLDSFARRGVAYRGHMGRELVLLLASELVRSGHLQEAKQSLQYLEEPADVQACMRKIAMSQARQGQIDAALETIDQLADPQAKNVARLGVAESLCETGKLDTARKLADFVLSSLQKQQEIDQLQERNYQSLAQLYGTLGCQPQLEQLLALANTPPLKADCVRRAVKGLALAKAD